MFDECSFEENDNFDSDEGELPPTIPTSPVTSPHSRQVQDKKHRAETQSEHSSTQSYPSKRRLSHQKNIKRIHKPGDPSFRFTCVVPTKESYASRANNKIDDRIASGDAWASDICHCITCEMHVVFETVKSSTEFIARNAKTISFPPAVVLWDLDNFGFNHMKQEASRLVSSSSSSIDRHSSNSKRGRTTSESDNCRTPSKAQKRDRYGSSDSSSREEGISHFLQNTVFWFFYGSCFTRRHSCTPTEHVGSLNTDDVSVWGLLKRNSALIFTPCAGHSQAADEVMTAIALGLFPSSKDQTPSTSGPNAQNVAPEFPTILVTRDKGLANSVKELGANVKAVRCVDPQEGGGTFIPFWNSFHREVENARGEFIDILI